ncbi:hypothetical protein P3X46_000322 [Hevea brasiliensis]|uniref:Uncharacterized protein n=1 Tax=Hevea brasiliensis TaxID=3981 RepID=A0ABQ9NC20_HEVBR|nr:CLAVATA3/ESR (CLE)-related protein 46 [Hevea brasiliensis]KAJ9188978.1 hypothetical protein P3X46_000322 [Hevea brasiliensis]
MLQTCVSHHDIDFPCSLNMNHLMPRMSRQILFRLLIAWVLLVAALHHFPNHNKVQAIESAHFKLKPAKPSSRLHKANIWPSWVGEKKVHKTPSGPNPVGNQNPPTKQ